jgi:hypothetical protein
MRDDNMAVSEVQRQVEAVALAVKQGSSVSDLRHHVFTCKLKGAQVRLTELQLTCAADCQQTDDATKQPPRLFVTKCLSPARQSCSPQPSTDCRMRAVCLLCFCLSACVLQVVYFRANKAGACDYVNDSRYWRYSHGTCWSELAEDLLVVDVPGDHFSLLRQDPPDMEVSDWG